MRAFGFTVVAALLVAPSVVDRHALCAQAPSPSEAADVAAPSLAAPGATAPAFTTASVKRSASETPGMRVDMPPGRLSIENASLVFLMGAAFGVPASSIEGGPAWTRSERFDVSGTTDPSRPRDDMQAMLRTLLAERFKLVTHFDGRDMPIYALVVDREDGRLGPQLRQANVDCAAVQAQRARGISPPPVTDGAVAPCSMQSSAGRLRASAMPLGTFAASISALARRPVRDRTGLAAGFDVDLEWMAGSRAAATQAQGSPGTQGAPRAPAAAVDVAAFFAALQEQLGLRLEPDEESVDVLVIDRVEAPSPD